MKLPPRIICLTPLESPPLYITSSITYPLFSVDSCFLVLKLTVFCSVVVCLYLLITFMPILSFVVATIILPSYLDPPWVYYASLFHSTTLGHIVTYSYLELNTIWNTVFGDYPFVIYLSFPTGLNASVWKSLYLVCSFLFTYVLHKCCSLNSWWMNEEDFSDITRTCGQYRSNSHYLLNIL